MKSPAMRRVLCLCVLALCVTGYSASSANAANWMVKGSNLEKGALPFVQIRGHGSLLFTVNTFSVHILCTGVGTIGFHLFWNVVPWLLGSLRGTGCTVRILNGGKEEETACEPHSAGQPVGTIVSKELEGELKLVEKVGVMVLKPKTGTTIETVEMGEECAIGEEVPIVGTLALKDSGGTSSLETEAKVHTVEQGPGTAMTALGKPATLTGKFEMELESGETWSGLPE